MRVPSVPTLKSSHNTVVDLGMPVLCWSGQRRRFASVAAACVVSTLASRPANALFLETNRRQLELCLVNLLRVVYWSRSVSYRILHAETLSQRQSAYLEARLGAKAILTGRLGGGANARVYSLGTLQLLACLDDLEWYVENTALADGGRLSSTARRRRRTLFTDSKQDFIESLAAIVEFDGMDSLKDASPRSTLTITQYNDEKATFVQRMLSERSVPLGEQLVNCFGADALMRSQQFVQMYYPSELNEGRLITTNGIDNQ